MSDATTRSIRVQVKPEYHPRRSDPARHFWFFSYTVQIDNVGSVPVQLLSRHWVITDATGKTEHVRGPGVVGDTPHLGPGESYQYTSACPLGTSMGSMHGSYQMVTDNGECFDAEVAPFSLCDPLSMN
jgi:ApaG protein